MKIDIVSWKDGVESFRATTRAPIGWKHLPGVLGSETNEGPFCEGYGSTPGRAVTALERRMGRTLIAAIAKGLPAY